MTHSPLGHRITSPMTPDRQPPTPEAPLVYVSPMLPRETHHPPLNKNWLVEIKWDGICALVSSEHDSQNPQITNKSGRDISHAFPEITPGFVKLAKRHSFRLHGEIISGEGKTSEERSVAIGRSNRNPFSARQGAEQYPCRFMAFDILDLDGRDLTGLPLQTRKAILKRLISESFQRRFNISVTTPINAADLQTVESGNPHLFGQLSLYEGLIFKRKNGLYVPGLTSNWLKFKFKKPTQKN